MCFAKQIIFIPFLFLYVVWKMSNFTIEYILNRAGERYSGTNGSLGLAINNLNNDINCKNNDMNKSQNDCHNINLELLQQDRHIENLQSGSLYSSQEYPTLNWLQYTRYYPPKLPRSLRQDFDKRTRTPGRLPRIPFTPAQLYVLENAYKACNYLSAEEANNLAITLNLTNTRIKIWFQNRRARDRREKRNIKNVNCESMSPARASNSAVLTEYAKDIL